MSDLERGYVVGLFEGEGTVGCYISKTGGKNVGRQISAAIQMNDKEPLVRLALYTGFNSVLGPYYGKKSCRYAWRISNRDNVEQFYHSIKELLSPRRIEQYKTAFNKYDGAM